MEDYIDLTKEEKCQIIRSHIKNIEYTKYNLELSILAEESVDVPNETSIIGFRLQLDDANAKELALKDELVRVENEVI